MKEKKAVAEAAASFALHRSLRAARPCGTNFDAGGCGESGRMNYLLVFVGGGLGASLRHFINTTCAKCIGVGFPWGTFIINITGSIVMGLIAGYLAFKGEG